MEDGVLDAGAGDLGATSPDIRVAELVAWFDAHPDAEARGTAFELLENVDALHRAGLTRLVELLVEARGEAILDVLSVDPQAAPLLGLYDLLPLDERTQVEDALETVRPYIQSHGGEVEVLDVVDGVVHLRLVGSCQGCSGSVVTLRRGVEEALRAGYPGFRGIEVHEAPQPQHVAPGGFIALDSLRSSVDRLRRPQWTMVTKIANVRPGVARGFVIDRLPVLLCNLEGEIYGFRNECPACSMPLHDAKLSGTVLLCPWQNCAFDARTGRRVDGEPGRLTVFPVAVIDGVVQLALNVPGTDPGGGSM